MTVAKGYRLSAPTFIQKRIAPSMEGGCDSNGKYSRVIPATDVELSSKKAELGALHLGRNGEMKRRWREYTSTSGSRPVKDFIATLTDSEAADVVAAMKEIQKEGKSAGRHLRGDIYEVRASSTTRIFRVLFASEGKQGQVLLALSAFNKKTQKTPPQEIDLAEGRLRDWRQRAHR